MVVMVMVVVVAASSGVVRGVGTVHGPVGHRVRAEGRWLDGY